MVMSIYLKSNDDVICISKSTIEFIDNAYDHQVYDLFDKSIRVVSGSTVILGTGLNYVLLFSADKLCTMFDVTSCDLTRLSIVTYNGDMVSQSVMLYSIQAWKVSLYQYFTADVSGQIRINYRLVYVYPYE